MQNCFNFEQTLFGEYVIIQNHLEIHFNGSYLREKLHFAYIFTRSAPYTTIY